VFKKLLLVAAATAAFSGTANASHLIINENFESGFGQFQANGNVARANGQTYAACCGTDAANTNFFAAFGGGNAPSGSLTTFNFETALGQLYTLTFDFAALGGGTETLFADVAGQTFQVNPIANSNLVFSTASFNFAGTGGTTTLSFRSSGVDNVDAILDNVSVSAAVPEPATWAMFLMGFGAVGYSMRSRKLRYDGVQAV
jgi:hypothetical protein